MSRKPLPTTRSADNCAWWRRTTPAAARWSFDQDADIYATLLDRDGEVVHALRAGRRAWVQVARGELDLNGQRLRAGDGAAIAQENSVQIAARADGTEFLLFDLP